jgi:hypothetical protein
MKLQVYVITEVEKKWKTQYQSLHRARKNIKPGKMIKACISRVKNKKEERPFHKIANQGYDPLCI